MASGFLTQAGNSLLVRLKGGQGEISYIKAQAFANEYLTEEDFNLDAPTPILETTTISYGSDGFTAFIDIGFNLYDVLAPATSIKSVMLFASLSSDPAETPYKFINIAEIPITGSVGAMFTLQLKDSFDSQYLDMNPDVVIGTPIIHMSDNRRHLIQQINSDPADVRVHSGGAASLTIGDYYAFMPAVDLTNTAVITLEKGFSATLMQRDIGGDSEPLNMKAGQIYSIQLTPSGFVYQNMSQFKNVNGVMAVYDGNGWRNTLPVGLTSPWHSNIQPSWGYFLNGQSVPVEGNRDLAIFYGFNPDSITSFNLPDLRGRVMAGEYTGATDNGRISTGAVRNTGGASRRVLVVPSHTHSASLSIPADGTNGTHTHSGFVSGFRPGGAIGGGSPGYTELYDAPYGGSHGHSGTVTINSTGTNNAQDLSNPYVSTNFVVVHGRV